MVQKSLTLLLLMLLNSTLYSQSYTEKYNDLYNRHEYFDSSNKMIGFKYYDSLYNVWKYKDLTRSENSSYINPINISLVEKVLSAKQARYDYNVERIQSSITDISDKIQTLDVDFNIVSSINKRFNETLNLINRTKYDYSSNSITNQLANYLYSQVNIVIKEEVERAKSTRIETPKFVNKHGGYKIVVVSEYIEINKNWIRTKLDNGKNLFYYDGDILYFKRDNANWIYRDLIFEKYLENENYYIYKSKWGYVYLKDDFTEIILFDHDQNGKAIKKYVFTIGNFDKNVIPY